MTSSIVVVALAALAACACTTRRISNGDSTNLDYRDGQIRKNYNGWSENLNGAIRMELLRA